MELFIYILFCDPFTFYTILSHTILDCGLNETCLKDQIFFSKLLSLRNDFVFIVLVSKYETCLIYSHSHIVMKTFAAEIIPSLSI